MTPNARETRRQAPPPRHHADAAAASTGHDADQRHGLRATAYSAVSAPRTDRVGWSCSERGAEKPISAQGVQKSSFPAWSCRPTLYDGGVQDAQDLGTMPRAALRNGAQPAACGCALACRGVGRSVLSCAWGCVGACWCSAPGRRRHQSRADGPGPAHRTVPLNWPRRWNPGRAGPGTFRSRTRGCAVHMY